MKKSAINVLSLLLSVLVLVAVCPLSAFAGSTETVIQTTIPEGVSELVSNPETNIVHSWKHSQVEDSALSYRVSYTYGSDTNKALQASADQLANITNGVYDEGHTDMSGFDWWEDGTYKQGAYVDITFNFPAEATVNNILLASSQEGNLGNGRQINEYKVYAGNELSSLYTNANVKAHYNPDCAETATHAQYITFGEAISAKYIGIRILNCTKDQSSYSHIRMREVALIGELVIPEEFKAISDIYVQPCIDALDTDYNLLNATDYVLSTSPTPGTVSAVGKTGDNDETAFSIRSYGAAGNDIVDHEITRLNADLSGVEFHSGNGQASGMYTDRYVKLTVALLHEANIDKFFISHAPGDAYASLRTYEYEVYASDSYEDLYDIDNKYWSFVNDSAKQNQVYEFPETITASFVGIKILKGVQENCAIGSSYARIAEVALFGEYNVPYYDYTVTSPANAGAVDLSGNVFTGRIIEASAPICYNGYTLRGWTINGSALEHTYDIDNNISNVSFEMNEDKDVVAVYTPDDTEFTGKKYIISADKTKVLVPAGQIFYQLKYAFDQLPMNIAAANTETNLEEKDYIRKGDSLKLLSKGETKQELEVVIASDFDDNGAVSVSDIVAATSAIIGNGATEDQKFSFDANGSGTLTVSDIIIARSTILSTPDEEADYTATNTSTLTAPLKVMGRSSKTSTGIRVDWTASGIVFNANCYGDVVINVSQGPNDNRLYTAVVDGKEEVIGIRGSATQDVVIAQDLEPGEHTIEFYKQYEGGHYVTFNSIKVNGQLLEAPANNDLLIEFVGDSITCGSGNLFISEGQFGQDGYYAYGTVTARLLGADWTNISHGGASLIDDTAANPIRRHMPTEYKYAHSTILLDEDILWDFETERDADIVVVNLGTNDQGIIGSYAGSTFQERVEYFSGLAYDFAQEIIAANGDDVKIIFAFGLMTGTSEENPHFVDEAYKLAVEKLADNNFNNAFYCRLPTNQEGGQQHPTIEGDIAAAEVLAQFIRDNVIS